MVTIYRKVNDRIAQLKSDAADWPGRCDCQESGVFDCRLAVTSLAARIII